MHKNFISVLSFFLCLLFAASLNAQDYRIIGKSIPELKLTSQQILPEYKAPAFIPLKVDQKSEYSNATSNTTPAPRLPKAWKYEELAFFCRLEVKMEKAAKFPIKFRLGEVQYVEKMEGKY